ncbi:MAG TPA: hypothetical protein VHO71_04210 [Caproiciproducens sp.]|nr:hypothetical protein [Caproiciproducens sp.]
MNENNPDGGQNHDQPQNPQGGYQNPQGGYQQNPQGGYQQNPQGGYQQNPQGGYQNPQGGYQQNPQGGYQQNPQGGYQNPQGGYQQNPQGGYQQNPQGGYQQNPQGGYQQNPQGYSNQQPPVYPRYGSTDNTKVFSILSYIGILWLVGLLADRDNPKVRYHLNQGILLTIFEVIVNIAVSILHGLVSLIFYHGVFLLAPLGALINGLLSLAAGCLFIAFIIIGIMHAVNDKQEPLPVIGTWFTILK